MSVAMDDIKYFITVSETLNITRASEIIGISQPALSYAIKRLEDGLGGKVFSEVMHRSSILKLREST
jgi:DNA-binding transcriptional LysR family regulator